MTRKDTILIAVVINAGLLAILFTTAIIYDTDKGLDPVEMLAGLEESSPLVSNSPPVLVASAPSTGDEVDNVLKYYHTPPNNSIAVESYSEDYTSQSTTIKESVSSGKNSESTSGLDNIVEVTVKKGDMLEKIARVHHSTVSAIKKANHLKSENLSIGQVLKVPVKLDTDSETKPKNQSNGRSYEAVYHVVKSGDNPWNIAKEYHVNYDDLLKLNDLNEEKARNLKIGDRIRVK
jgi:LysM repeat protein